MTMHEAEVAEALAKGQLELHFQPQVDLKYGTMSGVEGLIRLHHAGRLVPAAEFLPLLEQTPLIHSLGLRMFAEGCAAAVRWPTLTVAVNLSPKQFQSASLVGDLIAIAKRSGADRRRVELEITEGLVLTAPDRAEAMLRDLHQAGFSLALDDFGTGYSNFNYLRRFPVHRVKLDKSLIEDIAYDAKAIAIVRALVGLCHILDTTVVAEGVEHASQERILAAVGCDFAQGFRYAKAVPAAEIDRLLGSSPFFVDQPDHSTALPST